MTSIAGSARSPSPRDVRAADAGAEQTPDRCSSRHDGRRGAAGAPPARRERDRPTAAGARRRTADARHSGSGSRRGGAAIVELATPSPAEHVRRRARPARAQGDGRGSDGCGAGGRRSGRRRVWGSRPAGAPARRRRGRHGRADDGADARPRRAPARRRAGDGVCRPARRAPRATCPGGPARRRAPPTSRPAGLRRGLDAGGPRRVRDRSTGDEICAAVDAHWGRSADARAARPRCPRGGGEPVQRGCSVRTTRPNWSGCRGEAVARRRRGACGSSLAPVT